MVEIFVDYIKEHLYEGEAAFLGRLINNDSYVLGGSVVHKPQRNGAVGVVKNRTQLPAQVKRHSPLDATYPLDIFTTNPSLIGNTDKIEFSYDAVQSEIRGHMKALQESTSKEALYDIVVKDAARGFSAASIIRTTGTDATANLQGATGNRKLLLEADIQAARFALNKQGVSKDGRTMAIPSDLLQQLYDDLKINHSESYAKDVIDGTVPRLHGFVIEERNETIRFTNASTPVAKYLTDSTATTDNDSVICFVDEEVSRARGIIRFFENKDDATYFGDLYSAEVRFKVQKERADAKGVIVIVQA